jgi:hypothetical protein
MLITLADAATRLKRSVRQVRYLVTKAELPATKVGGVWMIDEAHLPLSEAAVRSQGEKAAALQHAVDEALAPHVRPASAYSVTSIRAFTELVALHRAARGMLLATHPALAALQQAALALSRGVHSFRGRAKAEAFEQARLGCADAVALLHLGEEGPALTLAGRIEAQVLPGIGGLVRRSASRGARGRRPRSTTTLCSSPAGWPPRFRPIARRARGSRIANSRTL